MIDPALVLTPLLVLVILALFRFTGCKPFGPGATPPDATTPGTPGTPPDPLTYEQTIAATPGLAAHWRLNETGGSVANVLPVAIKSVADGTYKSGPASGGLALGKPGVLNHKDPNDLAPELDGTAGYVEVPFHAPFNPAPNVPFTIELWVKPNPALGDNAQVVISSHKVDATPTNRGYEIGLVKKNNEPHQQVRARLFTSGAPPSEITVQPNLGKPDDWRHIVLTYEGGAGGNKLTLSVRVIGSINPFKSGLAAAAYENVLGSNACALRFGAGHQQGLKAVNHFAGRIDEIAFYNAAVPETEIENHFKQF